MSWQFQKCWHARRPKVVKSLEYCLGSSCSYYMCFVGACTFWIFHLCYIHPSKFEGQVKICASCPWKVWVFELDCCWLGKRSWCCHDYTSHSQNYTPIQHEIMYTADINTYPHPALLRNGMHRNYLPSPFEGLGYFRLIHLWNTLL